MSPLIGVVLAAAVCFCVRAPDTLPTAPAGGRGKDESTPVRVFRTLASFPAQRTRISLSEADTVSQKYRAEVLAILDEYERKVDAAAEDVAKNPPDLHALAERAQTMAEDFEADVLEKWLTAHPDAQAAVDRAADALDDISYALGEDRQQILAAASRAGLPPAKQAEGKKIIDETFAEFQAFGQGIEKQRQELGRLPEGDPRRLEGMTIMADVEMEELRAASTIRQKVRELLPAQRRKQFDEELAKLGEGR